MHRSASVCSNDLLAPRESARGAVSHLFVKNKSGERTRRDAQLSVTAARSAAVTPRLTGSRVYRRSGGAVCWRFQLWRYLTVDIHRGNGRYDQSKSKETYAPSLFNK